MEQVTMKALNIGSVKCRRCLTLMWNHSEFTVRLARFFFIALRFIDLHHLSKTP